jgi:xanthine/uracil permease
VAENIGHVKSVGQMTGTDTDPVMGRAIAADGLATTLAGFGGGSATTTYAENIGVMAATRVYSTAAYWIAAAVAVVLAMCPKVGAAISAIPPGVLGGATIVLYGLVGILGVRIWLTNHVDFSLPVNQMTAAIPLIIDLHRHLAGVDRGIGHLPRHAGAWLPGDEARSRWDGESWSIRDHRR